ncbi:hypothetical protein [Brevibacterium daeguense]|nr:hypothetical protein [Brevibacterium daeguense]
MNQSPPGPPPHGQHPNGLQPVHQQGYPQHPHPQFAQPGPYPYPPQVVVSPAQHVTVQNGYRRGTSHGLHLIITLLTGGLWLPVWLIVAIANRR